MKQQITIPKETLDRIREELAYGSQVEIAKRTNYSKEYVSCVLNSLVKINDANMVIVREAQRIIRAQRENTRKMIIETEKFVAQYITPQA